MVGNMLFDKEIIKALECCSKDDKEICAKECPIFRTAGCVEELHKAIIARIRFQEADVKDYKRNVAEMDNFARDLCRERMFSGNRIVTFEDLKSYIKKQKVKAVEEFAEVMKKKLQNVAKVEIMGCEYYPIGLPFIDNLVNEMFGNSEQVKGSVD